MTNGLSRDSVKWITYLVYILLSVLTIITGFHAVMISEMPDRFVRLERYKADCQAADVQRAELTVRIEKALDRIETKLDRIQHAK